MQYEWLALCGLLVTSLPCHADASFPHSDRFCGARCVQHVLELFGKKVDLITLIEEINGSNLQQEVPFTDLKDALENRGIYCRFVPLCSLDIPDWPQPVILHIDGCHYVVLEKTGSVEALIWDGLQGERQTAWWNLRPSMSNLCLVTTNRPFKEESFISRKYRIATFALGGLFIAVALVGFWRFMRIDATHLIAKYNPFKKSKSNIT